MKLPGYINETPGLKYHTLYVNTKLKKAPWTNFAKIEKYLKITCHAPNASVTIRIR